MPRKSMQEMRRRQLSEAAIEVLVQHGIRGTTLERVAQAAGVSKGIVLHNFNDKDALFQGVLRKTNEMLRGEVVTLLKNADTPVERLYAIIVGNFAPSVFHQKICHAWISLCADVPHNVQSQRIQTVVHSRMRSNLLSALKHMAGLEEQEMIAMQITTLIDGVWLRASLQTSPMSTKAGIDQMEEAIHNLLRIDTEMATEFKFAREKMERLANAV